MTQLEANTQRRLISQLKRQEGLSLNAYLDTEGVWTIGHGSTTGVAEGMTITKKVAELLLIDDIKKAESDASKLPGFAEMSQVRKAGFINVIFNIGYTKFSQWRNTMTALEAKDWRKVHMNMVDSIWVDQVGVRACEICAQIRLNRWVKTSLL